VADHKTERRDIVGKLERQAVRKTFRGVADPQPSVSTFDSSPNPWPARVNAPALINQAPEPRFQATLFDQQFRVGDQM
jgi:hypothetical protein